MVNNCKTCGAKLIGRSDKKFCDAQCRSSFNSREKRKHEQLILEINKTLRKNRKILKQFNPEGKTTIRKEYLDKLGYDYRYHTHSYSTKSNNTYHFCYDYGYFIIDDEKVLIVNWQPYMS